MNVDLNFNFMIWTTSWTNLDSRTFTRLKSSSWVSSHSCACWVQINHSIFHTPFWGKDVDNNDSEIILKIWKLDGIKFIIKIINMHIILVGCIIEVSGGFLRTPRKSDWAAFLDQSDPQRNHYLEVIFSFHLIVSCIHTFTMHWGQYMRYVWRGVY